jgi:deoxyribodipyrimidine photo-lyase
MIRIKRLRVVRTVVVAIRRAEPNEERVKTPTTNHAAPPAVVWFRRDLRLRDNPALNAACLSGAPLLFLFVLDDETPGVRPLGGAARWWLHHSLAALSADLAARGARLLLRQGRGADVVAGLIAEAGARALYMNDRFEPLLRAEDDRTAESLVAAGAAVHRFNASLLIDPALPRTGAGAPFKVFTPYWRAAAQHLAPPPPLAAPDRVTPGPDCASDALEDWRLLPRSPDWAGGLRETWRPGEAGAWQRLDAFVGGALARYATGRNHPGAELTSRLSGHLRHGEISPWAVWRAIETTHEAGGADAGNAAKFKAELGWREFAHHLLAQNPDLAQEHWRPAFDRFPWRSDPAALSAWSKGMTGYPIVDAGMRQLWRTGWMHNRVRMITASFLVKHLMIDWREGEAWFWDTLVDADPAVNAASWQWVAGSGADAAPFFRIFNPVTQAETYDADGAYVRRYVPELAGLAGAAIHQPWEALPLDLAQAGVTLGKTYPSPMVGHAEARGRALKAFQTLQTTIGET